eukprot:1219457-Pyramimonas_sp.AAC.1
MGKYGEYFYVCVFICVSWGPFISRGDEVPLLALLRESARPFSPDHVPGLVGPPLAWAQADATGSAALWGMGPACRASALLPLRRVRPPPL